MALLVFRATAKAGARPALAHAAGRRTEASLPWINPVHIDGPGRSLFAAPWNWPAWNRTVRRLPHLSRLGDFPPAASRARVQGFVTEFRFLRVLAGFLSAANRTGTPPRGDRNRATAADIEQPPRKLKGQRPERQSAPNRRFFRPPLPSTHRDRFRPSRLGAAWSPLRRMSGEVVGMGSATANPGAPTPVAPRCSPGVREEFWKRC
jgi:hypothetical protein